VHGNDIVRRSVFPVEKTDVLIGARVLGRWKGGKYDSPPRAVSGKDPAADKSQRGVQPPGMGGSSPSVGKEVTRKDKPEVREGSVKKGQGVSGLRDFYGKRTGASKTEWQVYSLREDSLRRRWKSSVPWHQKQRTGYVLL